MPSLSSPEYSNPGMAASTRQLPYVGGFGGRNRKVELPNIPGLRKNMTRAVAKELAAFQRMPISGIAKSIRLALGKVREKPEVITCSTYQAQNKEPEIEIDICEAFTKGRSQEPESDYEQFMKNALADWELDARASALLLKNHLQIREIRKKRERMQSPDFPIEEAMNLTSRDEGLCPRSYNSLSEMELVMYGHYTTLAARTRYVELAKEMISDETGYLFSQVEQEFEGNLPLNLLRVIEHLRRENQEIPHG